MPRVKAEKQSLITIESFEQADDVLRQLGDLQMKINQAEITTKEQIDEIKGELADIVKPFQDQISNMVRSLEVFCTSHRVGFGNKQSMKLNYGLLGWRKSTSVIIKKKTIELIKQVFSAVKAKSLIRARESVDKEALAKLTENDLASVGARRKQKELFFAEPSIPEVIDYVE